MRQMGIYRTPRTVDKLCPPEEIKPVYPTMSKTILRGLVTKNREALKTRLFAILDANGLFSTRYVCLGARLFKQPIMTAVAKQVEELVIEDLFDHKLVKKPNF